MGTNKNVVCENAEDNLWYGPVLITKGKHKGRIGYYDDDDDDLSSGRILIYPTIPLYCKRHYSVKWSSATSIIPTESIAQRWAAIDHAIYCERFENKLSTEDLIDLLHERIFCTDLLNERYFQAMKKLQSQSECCVFVSHASSDLIFARSITTDLINAGYSTFLDDWSIDLGDRIFDKINEGLEKSHALIMIISKSYLKSACCKDEWSAFYNKACHMKNLKIYPIIIDQSDPPMLLSQIKYLRVDRNEHSKGLAELLKALKKQFESSGQN